MMVCLKVGARCHDSEPKRVFAWKHQVNVAMAEARRIGTHLRLNWFLDVAVFKWSIDKELVESDFLSHRVGHVLDLIGGTRDNLDHLEVQIGEVKKRIDFKREDGPANPFVLETFELNSRYMIVEVGATPLIVVPEVLRRAG